MSKDKFIIFFKKIKALFEIKISIKACIFFCFISFSIAISFCYQVFPFGFETSSFPVEAVVQPVVLDAGILPEFAINPNSDLGLNPQQVTPVKRVILGSVLDKTWVDHNWIRECNKGLYKPIVGPQVWDIVSNGPQVWDIINNVIPAVVSSNPAPEVVSNVIPAVVSSNPAPAIVSSNPAPAIVSNVDVGLAKAFAKDTAQLYYQEYGRDAGKSVNYDFLVLYATEIGKGYGMGPEFAKEFAHAFAKEIGAGTGTVSVPK